MRRPILRFGEPVLHTPARDVAEITPDVEALIDDMVETMHGAPGIGLAAPQVGESLRVCVIDLSVGKRATDLIVLVNPKVISLEGLQLHEEGCLSVPGIEASVVRPSRLVVEAMDRGGHVREVVGEGLMARALQHELDHLDGRLFVDRLRPVYRKAIVHRIGRLQRTGRW